jgi:hypothetical protein
MNINASNVQIPEEILIAYGDIRMQNIMREVQVKYEDVACRNYWTEVFEDPKIFETMIKQEWKDLTDQDELPRSIRAFIVFIKNPMYKISPLEITQIYNHISGKLDPKI